MLEVLQLKCVGELLDWRKAFPSLECLFNAALQQFAPQVEGALQILANKQS